MIPPHFDNFSVSGPAERGPLFVVRNGTTLTLQAILEANNIAVVLGQIGTAAGLITILDLNRGQECLELLSHNPSLSPDGIWIMFRRFFPRSSDPDVVPEARSTWVSPADALSAC